MMLFYYNVVSELYKSGVQDAYELNIYAGRHIVC